MSEISYRPLIEDMTWSYSRITCFHDCPYRWYLKYIKELKESPQFYSSYGSFMHKLIEQYYKGELTKDEMQIKFLFDFQNEVLGERPKESTVQKYIDAGVEYLNSFKPFPFNVVDVEKKVVFEIDGFPFVGYIDYLGEKNGEYYIVDNKSRDLKPRSRKNTASDKLLDKMLRQLYIYAKAVHDEYGKFPKSLCFNCFKNGVFIEQPFIKEIYDEVLEWAENSIKEIENAEDFPPNIDFFSCNYICGYKNDCCYKELGGV